MVHSAAALIRIVNMDYSGKPIQGVMFTRTDT